MSKTFTYLKSGAMGSCSSVWRFFGRLLIQSASFATINVLSYLNQIIPYLQKNALKYIYIYIIEKKNATNYWIKRYLKVTYYSR